ncbi:MAG: NAD(P)H-dependent oxidoreductase subunit E [Candidatus Rokubacteria bacterium]|nr:NAD(P)H-dependent oxidoreductase subunit E [Candidatus Rokubacteria bacterium]
MTHPAGFHGTIAAFPRERRWLLPALQAVQHAHGWLPREALADVAAHLRVPASEVWGVASDYPELRLQPTGQHLVRVCAGVTCRLLGADAVLARVRERCGGDEITVEEADCFFACSVAPVIEVDGAYRGRVSSESVAVERWFDARGASGAEDPGPAKRADGSIPHSPLARLAGPGSSAPASAALDALVAAARARRAARPALRLLVGMGTCGRAVGGDDVLAALRDVVARRGLEADVVAGACNGMCYAAPVVEIERAGAPRCLVERVEATAVARLVDALGGDGEIGLPGIVWAEQPWRGLVPAGDHPFWRGQERVLFRRAGAVDPEDLGDALLAGAYRSLAAALDGSPERVIEEVKAAGLQGRGGAFFPAALKWEACRKAAGTPKYLVMNGEEGEPGIFKDRHLMEADPHAVLEGALIAAHAAGAAHVVLYVHGEANLAAARLARAVRDAEAAGLVRCTVEIRRGAGGFVLGEETALLESIEGRRAQPRTRPPFPVESGLWGRPTVINNVETLAAVPAILERGAAAFVALGTEKAPGTKLFGLSGPIARPGVVEARNGVTLRELLDAIGGGLAGGQAFLGAVVGGPSGTIVPAALFDVPMTPRERVSPGTGGIVAVPEGASIVDVVKTLLAFNARESCGKCTPCREGAPRLLAMIDELSAGSDATVARARDLADTLQFASLCGLGQAAPLALLRALEEFPDAFGPRGGRG